MLLTINVDIKEKLKELSNNDVLEICNYLQNCDNIFDNFRSEFKCIKFFELIGVYHEPTDIVIGSKYCAVRKTSKRALVQKEITMPYASVRKTLAQLFKIPGFYRYITEYVRDLSTNNTGVISNFIQGQY